jgi:hypothetical protein
VRLASTAYNQALGGANGLYYALFDGSGVKYGPTYTAGFAEVAAALILPAGADIWVTGLTVGTSYTLYWAAAQQSAADWEILVADDGGSVSVAPASNNASPAVMEVWN